MVVAPDARGLLVRRAWVLPESPTEDTTMRGHPLLRFHRAAEAAGYPALLVDSMFSLALVVAPVCMLALTGAVWVLALALLGLVAAIAVLAVEMDAAFADYDEPLTRRAETRGAELEERDRLALRLPAPGQEGKDREAA